MLTIGYVENKSALAVEACCVYYTHRWNKNLKKNKNYTKIWS